MYQSGLPGKEIKSFTLFVSRDALNIDGLSEATLEKFISMGFIHEYADMFHLEAHKDAIVKMEGFGQKSYDNLIASVKKASQNDPSQSDLRIGNRRNRPGKCKDALPSFPI